MWECSATGHGALWMDAFLGGEVWVSVWKVVGFGLPELCHVCWDDAGVYHIFGFFANFP